MVNKKIEDLRIQLNELIEKGADFSKIQEVSLLLDECLIEYYNKKLEKE
ncbi:MAG: Spo0E family sporulation regulatory protein-aspartic acid phosphatase [Clostridia bacterium]|nr:Spo0E family sporulation regulatory protein-aspartic acid phosphatase [Clostridia bacterium]